MKKIGMLFGIASIIVLTSCGNAKDETASDKDTTVVQTIEVPVETEKTTTTTTTTTTNDDGTTVEVDENGVTYGNKDGKTETKVKVTTDSAKIKIKR